MKNAKTRRHINQLQIILFHIGLGFAANFSRSLMKIYVPLVFLFFLRRVILSRGKDREVLFAAAYFAGAEVFFRMTKALVFYETGKYAVMFFLVLGMFYQGFKRSAFPYVIYILLLIFYSNNGFCDFFMLAPGFGPSLSLWRRQSWHICSSN